jgi:hypothetical protein
MNTLNIPCKRCGKDCLKTVEGLCSLCEKREPIAISGLMLRAQGNDAIVELEIDGTWHKIVMCDMRNSFSHIVEPLGIRTCVVSGHICKS